MGVAPDRPDRNHGDRLVVWSRLRFSFLGLRWREMDQGYISTDIPCTYFEQHSGLNRVFKFCGINTKYMRQVATTGIRMRSGVGPDDIRKAFRRGDEVLFPLDGDSSDAQQSDQFEWPVIRAGLPG